MYEVKIVWANGASVKNGANVGGNALQVFPVGTIFQASEIVPDSLDPANINKRWAKIEGGAWHGKYVAVLYPSSSGNPVRATWEAVGNVLPVPAPTIIGAILTPKLSDGTLGEPVEFVVKP